MKLERSDHQYQKTQETFYICSLHVFRSIRLICAEIITEASSGKDDGSGLFKLPTGRLIDLLVTHTSPLIFLCGMPTSHLRWMPS